MEVLLFSSLTRATFSFCSDEEAAGINMLDGEPKKQCNKCIAFVEFCILLTVCK